MLALGADPNALTPEAVAARIQPVGRVEFGAGGGAAPGGRSGEEVVKAVCATCHQAGVANAPKIGDRAAWAPHIKEGLQDMVATAIKGKGAMPPKGGNPSLTDDEVARAVVYMAKTRPRLASLALSVIQDSITTNAPASA